MAFFLLSRMTMKMYAVFILSMMKYHWHSPKITSSVVAVWLPFIPTITCTFLD